MSVRFVGSERLQRGRGIGGLLRLAGSVFKPLLSKAGSVAAKAVKTASKIAKSKAGQKALKALKEQAIDSSLNIATDVLGGQNIGDSLKNEAGNIKQQSLKKLETVRRSNLKRRFAQQGGPNGGKKKKRKRKGNNII